MIGQQLGKYRVVERVGRGGMGTVYRAVDETLHREVAIKILNAELGDPAVARRFRAEAVTIARLNHPGIAVIYELLEHEGQWVMVMEFLRGETLEELVAKKGPLGVKQASEVSMRALEALSHAHGLGVVHRDLKPANLMVTESGNVKVMDFGIARVAGTEHLTSVGFMMGTPAYMAPEQVLGREIDARADLYSVGVVLYFLLTAQLPFKGDTPFEVAESRLRDEPLPLLTTRADLPPWLGQVMAIALARDPARRFQTAQGFRETIDRGLKDLPIEMPKTEVIPAELIATALPGSMPVAEGLSERQLPSADIMPTVMASKPATPPPAPPERAPRTPEPVAAPVKSGPREAAVPVAPVPQPRPDTVTSSAQSSGARLWLGIAAGVLGLVLGGAWWATHRNAQLATDAAQHSSEMQASRLPSPGDVSSSATPAPAATADSSPASAPPDSSAITSQPLPPLVPGASPPTAAAAPTSDLSRSSGASSTATAPAARPTAAPATTGAAPAAAKGGRGRGASADPKLEFKGVRAIVLNGKKAEDRAAVLSFGAGQVSLNGEDGTAIGAISYGDLTYAVYVRARDPKWSVVLAAPPADADLPGGIFRSARHWLTMQSRAVFLIVRLTDDDFRKVIDTVTARTGVTVAEPAATSN